MEWPREQSWDRGDLVARAARRRRIWPLWRCSTGVIACGELGCLLFFFLKQSLSKRIENKVPQRDLHIHVHMKQNFHSIRRWKQCECLPTDKWIKIGLHTQWSIIQPYKSKGIPSHGTTWVNLENTMLSEK